MTFTILTLTAAYALVATLLAYLLLWSRLPLIFKAMATLATVTLIPLTFLGVGELRGLPTDGPIPSRFILLWAQIVEPNLVQEEEGRVFLWLQTLDEANFPVGQPRAYQLPFSEDLRIKLSAAMAGIADGEQVQGTVDAEESMPDETSAALALEVDADSAEVRPGNSSGVGQRIFDFEASMLTFGTAEAPVTPEKPQ